MEIIKITDKICKFETVCFSEPWSYNSVLTQLSMPDAVYTLNDAGYALGTAFDGECELYRIGVLPECRGRGEGKALLSEFINKCAEKCGENCRIFLEVRSKNSAAVSLYKSAGFIEIGGRKGYYKDDDALVFELNL